MKKINDLSGEKYGELKVGEYVRTVYYNIEKIEKIYKEDTYYIIETDQNVYESTWFKNNILNHSKNIIDLIEVGDYVNGFIVRAKDSKKIYWDFLKKSYPAKIDNIVTKEQFLTMKYVIKEERDG